MILYVIFNICGNPYWYGYLSHGFRYWRETQENLPEYLLLFGRGQRYRGALHQDMVNTRPF